MKKIVILNLVWNCLSYWEMKIKSWKKKKKIPLNISKYEMKNNGDPKKKKNTSLDAVIC